MSAILGKFFVASGASLKENEVDQFVKSDEQKTSSSRTIFLILPFALCSFTGIIDMTSVNIAISKVVPSLNTTVSGVQAAVAIYTLTAASFMIICGKLASIIGRRRIFILGLLFIFTGAILGAVSTNLPMFILGWSFIKGLGIAMFVPAQYSIISVVLPPGPKRLEGYAIMASSIAAGSAVGPLLSGLFATLGTWTWRLVPIFVAALIMVGLLVFLRAPKVPQAEEIHQLDVIGAVLSALGTALFVLGLLQASDYGWIKARKDVVWFGRVFLKRGSLSPVLPMVAAGFVFIALFCLWQLYRKRSGKEPLLDLVIFKIRPVSLCLLFTVIISLLNGALLFIIPLFLQMQMGLSPFISGLVLLPVFISFITLSQLTPGISKRFSQKQLITSGMFVFPLGLLLIWALLNVKTSAWMMLPGLVVAGIGYGTANAPVINAIQSGVPEKNLDETSGVNRSFFQLGNSLGTAIAGAVLITVLISSLWHLTDTDQVLMASVPKDLVSQFKVSLEEDAQTMSDRQIKGIYKKLAAEDVKRGLIPGTLAGEVDKRMPVLSLEAQKDGMLAGLLVITLIGFLGFILSLFLPSKEKVP